MVIFIQFLVIFPKLSPPQFDPIQETLHVMGHQPSNKNLSPPNGYLPSPKISLQSSNFLLPLQPEAKDMKMWS